jgi:hypothetical protein
MKRRLIATISLSLSLSLSLGLGGMQSAALAQATKENLMATNGDAAALGNGNASSAPGTVTRNGVSATSILGPDGTYRVTESSPPIVTVPSGTAVEIAPAPERAPVPEAPAEEISPESTALDTDGDSVADDDEVALYGTDPSVWDTDEDGLSDGDEVLTTGTDPFLWDTDGNGVADGDGEAARTDPLDPASVPEGTAETTLGASSEDSDADRLADANEAAVGTDPSTPDSDGDGYYDGDEVNLGTDPLDPASFPVASESPESP